MKVQRWDADELQMWILNDEGFYQHMLRIKARLTGKFAGRYKTALAARALVKGAVHFYKRENFPGVVVEKCCDWNEIVECVREL
jgi:hypothetical protein